MHTIPAGLNAVLVKYHYDNALEHAKLSDCREAQYGAVIFRGGMEIGIGRNHVPDLLRRKLSCDACPRRLMPQLRGGIGLELCVATHAEEAAIQDMLNNRDYNKRGSRGASMVVAKIKDGKEKVLSYPIKPYCTKCSGALLNYTELDEIIFFTERGFHSFGIEEFHTESLRQLHRNWQAGQPF